MYWSKAPTTTLSAACKGGVSDGMIEGLRYKRDDFCETRSGRKAWIRVKGATILVFKMSDQSGGESEATRLTGREIAGHNTRETR